MDQPHEYSVIVCQQGQELMVVTQTDHAKLAADILGLWLELRDHPQRRVILWAALHHDDGWQQADAAPMVDPSGEPCDFLTLPAAERIRVWERGTTQYLTSNPDGARLILQHALRLFRDSKGDQGQGFVAELEARLERLTAEDPTTTRELATSYGWLRIADQLSLVLCNRWLGPFETAGRHPSVRAELDGETMKLSPFPLAGTTRFDIPCRLIPARQYVRHFGSRSRTSGISTSGVDGRNR